MRQDLPLEKGLVAEDHADRPWRVFLRRGEVINGVKGGGHERTSVRRFGGESSVYGDFGPVQFIIRSSNATFLTCRANLVIYCY